MGPDLTACSLLNMDKNLEEHNASMFRIEELSQPSTQKTKAKLSSKKLVAYLPTIVHGVIFQKAISS